MAPGSFLPQKMVQNGKTEPILPVHYSHNLNQSQSGGALKDSSLQLLCRCRESESTNSEMTFLDQPEQCAILVRLLDVKATDLDTSQ